MSFIIIKSARTSKAGPTCAICKNVLRMPSYTIEDVGRLCTSCFESQNEKIVWKDLITEMKTVTYDGDRLLLDDCEQNIRHHELGQYEKIFPFLSVECLMPKDECQWTGIVGHLHNHFEQDHSNHILIGPLEEFCLVMNLEKALVWFGNEKEKHALKIKKSQDDDSLVHLWQNITCTSTTEDAKMTVECMGSAHKGEFDFFYGGECSEHNGQSIKLNLHNCNFTNINSQIRRSWIVPCVEKS